MANILIIGAGIAGLAAARQLKSSGFTVTVLEGRDRIGGRINTDYTLGFPLDLGASWIHGINGNPITQLAQDYKVLLQYTNLEKITLYDSNGQLLAAPTLNELYSLYAQIIEQAKLLRNDLQEDISLAEAVHRILSAIELPIIQKNLLQWYLILQEEKYGTDLIDYSLWEWEKYDTFSGGDYLVVNGYDKIIQELAQDIDIQLSQKVIAIKYNQQGVSVKTERADFTADIALITLPLGVLKSGVVKFYPPLPDDKLAAINRLGMGVLNKVVLKFPEIFWLENDDIVGYVSDLKPDFSHFFNLSRYISTPVIVALTGGSFARSLETLSEPEIEQRVMRLLRRVYGDAIPNPEVILTTKWASDPFCFGSYSTMPVGAKGSDRTTLAEPINHRLFFAGEATSRKYPSTVHGAFLSGLREAKRIQSLLMIK